MQSCLSCGSELVEFINFGPMPIANGFLTEEGFGDEYFFDLKVGFCPHCFMVQLLEQPDRDMMFHENYAYFSSISKRMALHFKEFAEMVMERYCGEDPFVVELGSNDGIMLHNFADKSFRHLGVEPSANVAEAARKRGVNTVCEFFDEDLAARILEENGGADAILAANVMCHIPYLHSVAKGVSKLLKPEGVLIFEDPYLGDILEKTSYDQIYDEHAFYFSVASVDALFREHGMCVVDVEPQDVHGGSMRYVIAREGSREISESVHKQNRKEQELGLKDIETYHRFRKNVEKSRSDLVSELRRLKDAGKRVVGYGATSKSTTVLCYCDIKDDLIEFISDTTPTKQGKLTPGAHIPVKPYVAFKQSFPDVALLFAWNHGAEIIENEKEFVAQGGEWLTYVPAVGYVTPEKG